MHGLYEPTWWINKEVLTLNKRALGAGVVELVPRSRCPLRVDARSEVVLRPDGSISDRLPEPFRACADVDLEDFLHRVLQFLLQPGQTGSPWLGVFAHPPVIDEADRNGVEVVQLLSALSSADNKAGLLK